MSERIEVNPLKLPEIIELLDWAKDEGWNPGSHDAAAFYAADTEGFLGCFVGNEMVAGISCVTYGDNFGFIGLYITRPDKRGKGYGLRVWEAAMKRLEGRVIGLDGVLEQQANYARMGFVKAYVTTRWQGVARTCLESGRGDSIELGIEQLNEVIDYERGLFPTSRRDFLREWLSPPHRALAIREEGRLAGYAVLRACAYGLKLGPLFADSDRIARELLASAMTMSAGRELHIDMPAYHTNFSRYLSEWGFQPGFETARMYKGGMPLIDMSRVFGITSLELG